MWDTEGGLEVTTAPTLLRLGATARPAPDGTPRHAGRAPNDRRVHCCCWRCWPALAGTLATVVAPVCDLGLLADRGAAHGDRASDRYLAVRRRYHGRRLVPCRDEWSRQRSRQRYDADLTTASADVARMPRREAGSDPAVGAAVTTLSTDLPAYAGVVQEANFNERAGNYPLAAAYLAEANNLMRTSILPAAAQVYGTEVNRLADDQSNAASRSLTVLAVVAFFGLLAALVLAQRWLSASVPSYVEHRPGRRHGSRGRNGSLGRGGALRARIRVWRRPRRNGSGPVSTFTDARILALRARADDELTLLTRDSDTSYQKDYASTAAALKAPVRLHSQEPARGSDPSEERQAARALSACDAYRRSTSRFATPTRLEISRAQCALASGAGRATTCPLSPLT